MQGQTASIQTASIGRFTARVLLVFALIGPLLGGYVLWIYGMLSKEPYQIENVVFAHVASMVAAIIFSPMAFLYGFAPALLSGVYYLIAALTVFLLRLPPAFHAILGGAAGWLAMASVDRVFDAFDNDRMLYVTGMLTAMSLAYVVAPHQRR
jgi:hypothetical protein